ncbi:22782_t:CDS:1, partial [Gigaspora margarita]
LRKPQKPTTQQITKKNRRTEEAIRKQERQNMICKQETTRKQLSDRN